jgi:uncharacterized membrane protein
LKPGEDEALGASQWRREQTNGQDMRIVQDVLLCPLENKFDLKATDYAEEGLVHFMTIESIMRQRSLRKLKDVQEFMKS